MPDVIIDTNVLAVAEGMQSDASESCRAACIDILKRVENGIVVVADSGDLILSQYVQVLEQSATAGIGVKLAKRLWRLRHGGQVCRLVDITPRQPPESGFEEVPDVLADFDDDDLMFVAVASADPESSPICQALDEQWWQRRADFVDCGIDVQFLCSPDLF